MTTTHLTCPLSCCADPGYGSHWKRNQESSVVVSLDPDATKLSTDQELKGIWRVPLLSWPRAEAFCLGTFQTRSTHMLRL